MAVKPLADADLGKLHKTNIVEEILYGIKELEKDISLNELDKELSLVFMTGDRKIKFRNLIKLLSFLVSECKDEPLTGKLIIEAETLINILVQLREGKIDTSNLITGKLSAKEINNMLEAIISHLEQWREEILKKVVIPEGNSYTAACYHPEFFSTYKFKPSMLPDDYKSNFFFEVMVKELCPFTTMISFHPFTDLQSSFQDSQPLAKLVSVDLNVNFKDIMSIERSDNMRAFRVHGPKEDKRLPGSYIMVRGGHHRMRSLFRRYLIGEIPGDLKVLVQLVSFEDFSMPKKELQEFIASEIEKRQKIRKAYS